MDDNCKSKLEHGTRTYINFIFQGMNNNILLRAISGDDTRTYYCKDFNEIPLEGLKKLNSEGYNIFVGIGTRDSKNGTKEHVSEISTLWTDIDIKEGEDRESRLKESLKLCKDQGLEPSLIVDSGHGYHLYFKMTDSVNIECVDDINTIESRLRWLESKLEGDCVHDVSRIMRIPGFLNNKNPQEPKQCSILQINENATYDLEDFGAISEPQIKIDRISLGEIPDEIPPRFYELLESNSKLKQTWNGQRKDLDDCTGSGHDMSLASILVRRDFQNEEIARILLEAPYPKKSRTNSYLEYTIAKARSGYEEYKALKYSVTPSIRRLSEISLKPEDFTDCKIEYLIDDFLPKNTLMLMTGSYGVGKSYFCLALTKKLISEGNTVVIADLDMPKHIIEGRLMDSGLMKHLGTKLHYVHSTNYPFKIDAKNDKWIEFKQLIASENEAIVIFDNLKEIFPTGQDPNDDNKAIAVMNELKEIRDMINTVILLHHVPKESSTRHPFKNSGSIADTVDIAYKLERSDNECSLRCFKSRVPVKENVKFALESNFSLHEKQNDSEQENMDRMLMIYEYMTETYDGANGFLQKVIIENLPDISRDKVRETLLMGENILWKKTQGTKNSHIYKPIKLNSQNSKSVPIYILKKLRILESDEDIASFQEEPLESHMGENIGS